MNKLLLLFCLVGWPGIAAFSQVSVDGTNINELDITYCQIIGVNRTGLTQTRVWIDYGQPKFVANLFNTQAVSGPGHRSGNFNTVIDALNFMVRNGWELVSSQVTSEKDEPTTYVYLLKKVDGRSKSE